MASTPPTSRVQPSRPALRRRDKLLLAAAMIPIALVGVLIGLRSVCLLQPFSVPTGTMTPAIADGDHVMMEGFTFLAREPRHGDVVVFRTEGLSPLLPNSFLVRRVAGTPGDRVWISDGVLFVNDRPVALSNDAGRILYAMPPNATAFPVSATSTVPANGYFVLGDNSTNSLDSRFWGTVPRDHIHGRIWFCYWPPSRIGVVK